MKQLTRTKRAVMGAACLVAVALAMGWFAGRYIPGEPGTPEAAIGEGLAFGNGHAATKTTDFEPGATVELRSMTQGTSHVLRDDELAIHDSSLIEQLKALDVWDYDSPDVDIAVVETKTVDAKSFAEWYPEYKTANWETYYNSKIVAVTLSITNRSDSVMGNWQKLPEFTLWSDNVAHIDGSLGSGVDLDRAFWMLNVPLRDFDETADDPDYGRYIDIEPGESQDLVIPFRVNKNNLVDQAAFDTLDPTDFCIQTTDYDTGTVYRLWL